MPREKPVKTTAALDVVRLNLHLVNGAVESLYHEVGSLLNERDALQAKVAETESARALAVEECEALQMKVRTYEAATHDGAGDIAVYAGRLARELHKRLAHPDYEYTHTEGQRKTVWDDVPKAKDGEIPWERNTDHHDGFERFDYHEESYWRRLKPVEQEMCDLHTEQPEPCITCEAGGY